MKMIMSFSQSHTRQRAAGVDDGNEGGRLSRNTVFTNLSVSPCFPFFHSVLCCSIIFFFVFLLMGQHNK